ncbi:mannose-1-phosphate guanylyltransferase/mannose-6-phosphate isomerase [Prosthecomicrobium sp. N25]|uniref:mannose-1-phosphate guanylyltransferase/mannose-6-phosphate isomerase n=1 Tax=Prosthecomicrobium sp. N25 TaxID=3129254 RepID=UPI003077889D
MAEIIPVVLCGGSGSRLWPASRDSYPKQFLALSGPDSLFQATLRRVAGVGFGPPVVVTGADYRFLVAEQMRAIGAEGDIVLEPLRRDSCAAIAAAAEIAARRDPAALVLVLAADHAIPDRDAFLAHVERGRAAAEAGRIVTFGIRPDRPATGYGYIRPGAELAGAPGVHAIAAFVEKPDAATAERYLADGYLWNSGNFLFAARVFLDELARLAPGIAGPVGEAVAGAARDLDFLRLEPAAFARSVAKSVDYAVMEKTERAAVVPSDFGWSDIGSWSSLWDLAAKDADGNAAVGEAVFVGARNCYVSSPDMLTAVIGLEDTVVVTTKDAVLVSARGRAEEVKTVVARLAAEHREEATQHRMSYRPWGSFESIDRGLRYQVKRITVRPGGKLSLQSHVHRSEHWVVVSGTARVTVGDEVRLLTENQSIYIPLGALHRLENPGHIPLEIIEVQSGSYLAEDDIVRHEDIYHRT